jgi:hypothetical protein
MTSKQTSKESLESVAITVPTNRKKITLAVLIIAVSLSVAIEFGVAAALTQGYSTPADKNMKGTRLISERRNTRCRRF